MKGGLARMARQVAVAAVASAAGVGFRALLEVVLRGQAPFVVAYGAVALAAWYGGLGAGVLAAVLSGLAVAYLWLPPAGLLSVDLGRDWLSVAAFAAVSALIVGIIEALHRSRRRIRAEAEERVQAERELTRSRELLELVFSSIADGITVQDRGGRLLMANESAARIIGFRDVDELVRTPVAEILRRFTVMDERREPLPLERLPGRRALQEGRPAEALLCYRLEATGEERWSLTRSAPVRGPSGETHSVVNVFHDMTERRRGMERLEFLAEAGAVLGSSLNYDDTLSAVARLAVPRIADWCAVHIADDHGAVRPLAVAHRDPEKVRWARALQERYPVRPDAPRGAPAVMRSGVSELVPNVTDEMLVAAAVDAEQLALLRSVGFRSYLCVPLTAQGRTVGTLSLVTAESGRVYDLADLTTAEILGRRAGLAVENARLFHEAQEANRLKDEFLATLSHELRTPLNAIVGWSDILRQGLGDAATVARAVDSIHRNAQAQTQLVSDLLDVSRITSGKLRLSVGAVDLVHVVQAALDTVRPAAEGKRIQLQPVLDRRAGQISGDADRLQQVVWNLLSNAVKFTPKDGRVHVRVEAANSHVEVVVEDTGPGIDQEFLPHVFDRFRQQDASTTRPHQGLGLGLAIARHLVEMHGGTITARNKDGRSGAVFTVSLPRRSVAVREEALFDSRDPRPGGPVPLTDVPDLTGIRVLVVDDHEDARDLVQAVLERQGAEVVSVGSARAAFEAIEAGPPDVLLADVEMPGEDGYSLIRRVRGLPPESGGAVPAAALTAYATSQDRVNALLAGYSAHLAKPVEAAELVAVVARLASPRTGGTEAAELR